MCVSILGAVLYIPIVDSVEPSGLDDWAAPLQAANKLLSLKKYDQAYTQFKKYAEQENGLAQFTLALFFENGFGRKISADVACHWYKRAAGNNIPRAQQKLGDCFFDGVFGELNKSKALQWYEQAYKSGLIDAACQAGEMYLSGAYAPKSINKGLGLCVEAANAGSIRATSSLGKWYFEGRYIGKDQQVAFSLLEDAAKRGDPESSYYLAKYYDQGINLDKDLPKALFWYESAASKGFKQSYLPTSALYWKSFEDSQKATKGKLLAKAYLWAKTSATVLSEPTSKKDSELILDEVNKIMPVSWRDTLNAQVDDHIVNFH